MANPPSTGDRRLDSLRNRAASKIIWGEREDSVYKFLRKEGVSTEMADQFIKAALKERAAKIRQKSMIRLTIGGIATLILGSVFVYNLSLSDGTASEAAARRARILHGRSLIIFAAGTCLCGLYSLKHLWIVISGKSLGSAVEDGT